MITNGSQPVGRGIGPALEAMDVLSVLRNETSAPQGLKERSLQIAAEVLELAGASTPGEGIHLARQILESGRAYKKFEAICRAQGEFKEPQYAPHKIAITSKISGKVVDIDNRKLAKIAKLAGAPKELSAGLLLNTSLNCVVKTGDVLFTIYAAEKGELGYALEYLNSQQDIIVIN